MVLPRQQGALGHVGMVDEGHAARLQLAEDPRDVAVEHIQLGVDQGIKREDEVERAVFCRVQ
ncbi:hypothetical protein D3C73_1279820 [compost metagenome]